MALAVYCWQPIFICNSLSATRPIDAVTLNFSIFASGSCRICHRWPRGNVCTACADLYLAPCNRCLTCSAAVAVGTRHCLACRQSVDWPIDACHAAVPYAFPWVSMVADLKFRGHSALTRSMARLMLGRESVREAIASSDIVVGVPLSKGRLSERGFNQAHELAKCLSPQKASHGALMRHKDTPAQVGLDRRARATNLSGVFGVDPLRIGDFSGKQVLLIDDVMTTGATLCAAAQAVRDAGASYVVALVFARTDPT